MTLRTLYALALVAAGCSVDVPDDPTWTEHVRPILAANCIRCHSVPPTGGAPDSFRLDTYEDTFRLDGTQIRGATTMARFIAVRAGEMGEMPPDYPRTDGQRDILINWWTRAEEQGPEVMPALGPFRPSRAPDAVALDLPATADSDPVTVRYEITDFDGDLVDGVLFVGRDAVSTDLRDGRGEVTFDPSYFPPGPYDVVAQITDDIDIERVTLGTIDIDHAGGNTSPRVTFVTPRRDLLITDLDLPFQVIVTVTDPDPPSAQTLDLIAFRGTEEIVVAENLPINFSQARFDWDTNAPAIPFGTHWRLRAVVDDGSVTGVTETGPFIVSHDDPDRPNLAFTDLQSILNKRCVVCHPSIPIRNVFHNFALRGSVKATAGLIYRRAIQQETMPPPSAPGIISGFEAMTDAERATLAAYLLDGAR